LLKEKKREKKKNKKKTEQAGDKKMQFFLYVVPLVKEKKEREDHPILSLHRIVNDRDGTLVCAQRGILIKYFSSSFFLSLSIDVSLSFFYV
jgi:hypothetical protein